MDATDRLQSFSRRSSPTGPKPTRERNPIAGIDVHAATALRVLLVHILVLRQHNGIRGAHPRRSAVQHHPVILQLLGLRREHVGKMP